MQFMSTILMNLRWKPICKYEIVVQLLCDCFWRFGFGCKYLNISDEVSITTRTYSKAPLGLSNFKKSGDWVC